MEIKTHKTHYAGKLMPWGKGTVVRGAKGFVFLAGTEGRHPDTDEVVEGAEAQTRMCMEKIKSHLEELGSDLNHIIKMTFYVAGQFPDGVASSEKWITARRVRNEFFREHAPHLCDDNNPPTLDLVGVSALARKEMIIEVAVVAALKD